MYEHGTQYYNLPQTVGTDKRDWFDTNTAFANVDADLHSAKQTAETTATTVSGIEGDITALDGRLDTVEGDIVTINGDIRTANDNIGINATAIGGLQITVADNKQDLEDMITAYEEATATASSSHNVGDYFRYNDTLYITTITIRVGDTIVPDVNCRSTNVMTRIKALEGGGGGESPLAESIMYDNETSGLTADNVQEAIDELDGTLDTAVGGVQSNATHIGDLTSLLTEGKSNLVSAINELVGMIGGMRMRCALTGVFDVGQGSKTIDISSLNLSSAEDYFVILNSGLCVYNSAQVAFGDGLYITEKTATSFTVRAGDTAFNFTGGSYQVITLV